MRDVWDIEGLGAHSSQDSIGQSPETQNCEICGLLGKVEK
jgi:hypothetical protein